VGADWHQDAISSLCNGLRDVARAGGWPWHVGDQLTLVAWHPDGSTWRPKPAIPDIMVHPHSGAAPRSEMNAATDGLPALIIEVANTSSLSERSLSTSFIVLWEGKNAPATRVLASKWPPSTLSLGKTRSLRQTASTYGSDVNISPPTRMKPDGKGFEYLAWPLPKYLVFDPTEAHLPGQVRAWRVDKGRVREWRPDVAGRYQSMTLSVSFSPEGFFLRIFDSAGVPIPFDHEKADTIARLERENAALLALIERLRA